MCQVHIYVLSMHQVIKINSLHLGVYVWLGERRCRAETNNTVDIIMKMVEDDK